MGGDRRRQAGDRRGRGVGPAQRLPVRGPPGRAGATGAMTRAAFGGQTTDGVVELGAVDRGAQRCRPTAAERAPELVVGASGNLGLIFFPRLQGRVTLETLEATLAGPHRRARQPPGHRRCSWSDSESTGPIASGRRAALPRAAARSTGRPGRAVRGHAARRLHPGRRHGALPATSSRSACSTRGPDEVAAFEELIGSHGGLGGAQTEPFILHPVDWPIDEELVGAEAVYRQIRRWLEANGIPLGRQGAAAAAPTPAATRPAVAGAAAAD